MSNKRESNGYGITIFKHGTPLRVKVRKLIFFVIFCLIIVIQACYWLFANSARPIILGMPFGMFFIVLFIVIEFLTLLVLYFIEGGEMKD